MFLTSKNSSNLLDKSDFKHHLNEQTQKLETLYDKINLLKDNGNFLSDSSQSDIVSHRSSVKDIADELSGEGTSQFF